MNMPTFKQTNSGELYLNSDPIVQDVEEVKATNTIPARTRKTAVLGGIIDYYDEGDRREIIYAHAREIRKTFEDQIAMDYNSNQTEEEIFDNLSKINVTAQQAEIITRFVVGYKNPNKDRSLFDLNLITLLFDKVQTGAVAFANWSFKPDVNESITNDDLFVIASVVATMTSLDDSLSRIDFLAKYYALALVILLTDEEGDTIFKYEDSTTFVFSVEKLMKEIFTVIYEDGEASTQTPIPTSTENNEMTISTNTKETIVTKQDKTETVEVPTSTMFVTQEQLKEAVAKVQESNQAAIDAKQEENSKAFLEFKESLAAIAAVTNRISDEKSHTTKEEDKAKKEERRAKHEEALNKLYEDIDVQIEKNIEMVSSSSSYRSNSLTTTEVVVASTVAVVATAAIGYAVYSLFIED